METISKLLWHCINGHTP